MAIKPRTQRYLGKIHHTMRLPIAFALCLLAGLCATAQNYITLQGRITDTKSRQAVPYAAVLLKGSNKGSQSNDAGHYTLKVPSAEGTVVFSAIGYKRMEVNIKQLQKNGNMRLEPHALQLREVAVTGFRSPQALIAEAVSRLPQNYHTDTTVGTWFHRDWRMLNGELYLFDESVVEMLRYGYTHNAQKRYYHYSTHKREMDDNYKSVHKHRLLVYDSVAVKMAFSGNTSDKFLQYSDNRAFYDMLSTPNANYLTAPRLVKRHRFDPIQEYTDDDGQDYYLLRATHRDGETHYTWLIHKADLAIVELQVINDSSTTHFKPSLWSVQPYASIHRHGSHSTYRYAKLDGAYTLTSFSSFSDQTCRSHLMYGHENDLEVQHFVSSSEWHLTDLRPGDTTFLMENTVQSHQPTGMNTAFGESHLDEDFWEQYNTLALDTAVQAHLERALAKTTVSSDTRNSSTLDSLQAVRRATPMTMPPMPRWTFYRYGGIGGNRMVGDNAKSKRGFSQQLAVGTKLHLGGRLNLHADLQYAWMTTRTDIGRFNTHSLTLPLRLDFDLIREKPEIPMRLYLIAGGWGRYAFLGRLGGDWHGVWNTHDRIDYGWNWGIGIEVSRIYFLEWNSYRSLHNSLLNTGAPALFRHNGAFTIGINF